MRAALSVVVPGYLVLGEVVLGVVVVPLELLPMLPEVLPAAPVLEPY